MPDTPAALNLPDILDVKTVDQWSNYSGTVTLPSQTHAIPNPLWFCTPRPAPRTLRQGEGAFQSRANAVNAILKYCFANQIPLRPLGSRWSFSDIIQPTGVILDTPNLNDIVRIGPLSQTDAYKATRGAQGFAPVWVMGGAEVSAINRRFLKDFPNSPLCLQTSGAADGHRMAGCIATGTHGAAIQLGALHDTVLAIHLLVAPDKSVLIQPSSSPALSQTFVDWLRKETGIPLTHLLDDDLFAAAQVSLGSLGVLFSLVVEAAPAYKLLRHVKPIDDRNDPMLWNAIKTLDSRAFYPGEDPKPYHFEVLFNPYPVPGKPSTHLRLMWKKTVPITSADTADMVPPAIGSDTMSLISRLVGKIDGTLTGSLLTRALGLAIYDQLKTMFEPLDGTTLLPGLAFGVTNLPKGTGASTEIVVDHADTERTVRAMWDVFAEQAKLGKHLLGAMALRFVPASKAHLAMNINPMNCFIELPSINNPNVLNLYAAIWDRLEALGIPFTCHWGQLSGMNPSRMAKYFKGREEKWKNARDRLLDPAGRKVFSSPLLKQLGLD